MSALKRDDIGRAVGYGVGAAAAGTILLGFVPLGLIGFAILGFVVGEVVSLGANRKRLPELGPIAVGCLLLGYELGGIVEGLLRLPPGLAITPSVMLFIVSAPILELTRGLAVLGILLAAVLAWVRAR